MNASSRSRGFTVIELSVVVVFLAVTAIFLLIQRNDLQATQADTQRKTAVNAFYYGLEKVYYPAHQSYPQTISTSVLPSVDPALFTDVHGKKQGDRGYEYKYEPIGCTDGVCKNYTLTVTLQKEAMYVKKSDR
jgi:type II secretory pathway pseudopilin PulG